MKRPLKYQNYIALGVTILAVVACSLLLFFIIFRFDGFKAGIGKTVNALMPVIYGVVIAYMLTPLCNALQRVFLAVFPKRIKSRSAVQKLANGLSVFVSLAFGIFIVVGLLLLVIPQLVTSIRGIVDSSQDWIGTVSTWIEKAMASSPELEETVMAYYTKAVEGLQNWLQASVLPNVESILASVSNGVLSVIFFFKNLLIGLVVAVYLLFSRKLFVNQMKKTLFAIFPLKPANIVLEECQFAHRQFTSFISGNLLDSFIIGLLTFVFAAIMRLPFIMVIAVLIGVTNIIPFFGPFIGAIPCAILILLVNPFQCLYFLIFIFLLQQFDGNILKPKILGQTSGLSSFWVLFSLLLFGGLFGFPGMILGVPVFAVIYDIVKKLLAFLLNKRSLPTGSSAYNGIAYMGHPDSEVIEGQSSVADEALLSEDAESVEAAASSDLPENQ